HCTLSSASCSKGCPALLACSSTYNRKELVVRRAHVPRIPPSMVLNLSVMCDQSARKPQRAAVAERSFQDPAARERERDRQWAQAVAATSVATEPAPQSADKTLCSAVTAGIPHAREPWWRRERRRWGWLTALASAVIVILAVVCIIVSLPGAWLMFATLLIG